MSTILKALRRLEQEKAAQSEGRPLREEIAGASPEPAAPRSRRWLPTALVGLAVGAVVGAAVVAWLRWGPETPPAEVAAAAPPAQTAPLRSPAETAAAAGASERRPAPRELEARGALDEEDAADAFASPVEVVERPPALPRLSDPSPVQPAQRPKPGQERPVAKSSAAERARRTLADAAAAGIIDAPLEPTAEAAPAPNSAPEPAPVRVAEAPPPTPPEPAPAKPEPKPAPAPEPVRAAPEPAPEPKPERVAAAPPPAPEPAPAPKPAEPAPAPAPLPALLVEKTLWHPSADRRRAWLRIDGEERRVVEGDVVEGLLVAEIEPSGIVLERDGERIRRGLGSTP